MSYYGWPKYVPVAKRREQAAKHMKSAQKKGQKLHPILIEGRKIAKTFWGEAWCDHLESYSDYDNRLPRGRTYVRNGSVIDLQISAGKINAQVMGSQLYKITIDVQPMPTNKWNDLVKVCAGKIDSLIELLQGKFSDAVMLILTNESSGLFPKSSEISMRCTCPDYAGLCKHVAAVLYGIGASLDIKPEWLFTLRCVNHLDLIASASKSGLLSMTPSSPHTLDESNLSELFGIEMAPDSPMVPPTSKKMRSRWNHPL